MGQEASTCSTSPLGAGVLMGAVLSFLVIGLIGLVILFGCAWLLRTLFRGAREQLGSGYAKAAAKAATQPILEKDEVCHVWAQVVAGVPPVFGRPYFVAVTNRRFIFVGNIWGTMAPTGSSFSFPIDAVSVERFRSKILFGMWDWLWLRFPDGRIRRLAFLRHQFQDDAIKIRDVIQQQHANPRRQQHQRDYLESARGKRAPLAHPLGVLLLAALLITNVAKIFLSSTPSRVALHLVVSGIAAFFLFQMLRALRADRRTRERRDVA